jgi:hypothetical protein
MVSHAGTPMRSRPKFCYFRRSRGKPGALLSCRLPAPDRREAAVERQPGFDAAFACGLCPLHAGCHGAA